MRRFQRRRREGTTLQLMDERARWRWEIDRYAGDDEQKRCFLYQRWFDKMELVDRRERTDARRFIILRGLAIIGAGAISALAGIGAASSATSASRTTIEWIVFALGITVAASSTLEQLAHFGQHRLLGRQAREALKAEGSKFFWETGEYESLQPERRWNEFKRRVEAILDKYNRDYERTISEGAQTPAPPQESVASKNVGQ
jgi:Protein of unknown function (DUF4231)